MGRCGGVEMAVLWVLLTCGDFCDELCRIVAALHYTPCPQWEVSTGLSPEQMSFNPLSCTGTRCKRQIHPWLRWAFSWARMNQSAIGFENTLRNCNNSALHQNPHLNTALLCTFLIHVVGSTRTCVSSYSLRRVKVQGSEHRSSWTHRWWHGCPKIT